jgi:hypothetical protein
VKRKIYFLIATFFISFSAKAGGDSLGNGGSLVASDVVTLMRSTLQEVGASSLTEDQKKILALVQTNVDVVTVKVEDSLTLNGVEVDAINYPEQKLILFSQSRWQLNPNPQSRSTQRLILHEYLGVSGLNDATYALSIPLIQVLQKASLQKQADVKRALQNLDQAIKVEIKALQDGISKGSGVAVQTHFCEQDHILNFDQFLDVAYRSLHVNQSQLENNGVMGISKTLDLFMEARVSWASKCNNLSTNPPEIFEETFLQFDMLIVNILSVFP